MSDDLGRGVVYTETVVHSPPAAYASDAPYQLVIVTLEGERRITARVLGERVAIGDVVDHVESRDTVPYFRKADSGETKP
jgi:uncharacterized OB-fold protein